MVVKKTLQIACCILVCASSLPLISGQIVDRIAATVGLGPEKIVVTASDLDKAVVFANMEKAPLNGHIEHAMQILHAKSIIASGMTMLEPSDATVKAQMERLKISLGITDANGSKAEDKLQQLGLSTAELQQQVYNFCLVSHLWQFIFPNAAVAPLSAIEAYCEKHPETISARAQLMVAEVDATRLQELINKHRNTSSSKVDAQAIGKKLEFCDLGQLEIDQLDDVTKTFVKNAHEEDVYVPSIQKEQLEHNDKLRVIKLVNKTEKHLRTLEERKAEITAIIQFEENSKRYKEFMTDLEKQVHVKINAN